MLTTFKYNAHDYELYPQHTSKYNSLASDGSGSLEIRICRLRICLVGIYFVQWCNLECRIIVIYDGLISSSEFDFSRY